VSGFPPRPRRARGVPQEFCAAASKAAPMGWVVKQWRLDTLERLLAEATQAELASARAAAERDARRARRAADRTAAAAERELGDLERIGDELRTTVRDWRVWLRDAAVDPATAAPPGLAALRASARSTSVAMTRTLSLIAEAAAVGVMPRAERTNNGLPKACSRDWMLLLRAGWEMLSCRAASPSEPVSRTARKWRSLLSSIEPPSHGSYDCRLDWFAGIIV